MLSRSERDEFDRLLDGEVEALPPAIFELLDEVPLIVDDEPSAELLQSLGMTPGEDDLCGLHDATPFTEQSVEHGFEMPGQIMLFRGPIQRLAAEISDESGGRFGRELRRQIHITLLHEIGHHFGLEEDDLQRLGYG
ncbi:MAG: metallopeptidase family protein [Planctomycetota bacterium]